MSMADFFGIFYSFFVVFGNILLSFFDDLAILVYSFCVAFVDGLSLL